MEKTGSYGKDGSKAFKSEIFGKETHPAHNLYSTYNTTLNRLVVFFLMYGRIHVSFLWFLIAWLHSYGSQFAKKLLVMVLC